MKKSVFITNDIILLLNYLKDKNYVVNEGYKTWRKGENNSMNSLLSHWDLDFRESMYEHYIYHLNKGNINIDVPKKRFSFNNIHLNLGK